MPCEAKHQFIFAILKSELFILILPIKINMSPNYQYLATIHTKTLSFTKQNYNLKQSDFESFQIINYDAKL